jgi:hypothetical protein
MTTLAANVNRVFGLGNYNAVPVIASDIIYMGAAVGENGSGYARPLVAGDPFLGFAEAKVDNSSGAAGDLEVNLITKGRIQLSVTGVTGVADIGKPVYAADDNDFTLTESTNSLIGRIIRHVTSTTVIVEFDATRGGAGKLTPLTDNSGGTANDTLTALGGITSLTDNSGGTANDTIEVCGAAVTGVDGTGSNAASKADVDARLAAIANNFADVAAKVNALIADMDDAKNNFADVTAKVNSLIKRIK